MPIQNINSILLLSTNVDTIKDEIQLVRVVERRVLALYIMSFYLPYFFFLIADIAIMRPKNDWIIEEWASVEIHHKGIAMEL